MKYKLIGENNFLNPLETVLHNRGVEEVKEFLKAGENPNVEHHYSLLNNIQKAVDCIVHHAENSNNIFVQVDPDPDGVTSSAMLINYLTRVYPDNEIQWRMQEGRVHGIKSDYVPDEIDLVIVPDAGSSDFLEHEKLVDRGKEIVILDHHETDDNKESEYAIVVNNQLSTDYPNKDLSGAGVVYKTLQALDSHLGVNHADDYLDLTAVGLIADMMSMKELENRYLVTQGLKAIKNPMLEALFIQQEYSTKGVVSIMTVSWYITPLINAALRVGTTEERELMFKAFLGNDEQVWYERGKKYESIYTNTARQLTNIRARQNRQRDKGVEELQQRIVDKELLNNKILIVDATDVLEANLTGLVANMLSRQYRRPTLLLRQNKKDGLFGGSARGYEKGYIAEFKDFLEELDTFNFVRGHQNAFGFEIDTEGIIETNELINTELAEFDISSSSYDVDFIIPAEHLQRSLVLKLDGYSDLWGRQVEEPLLAITGLKLGKADVSLIGRNKNTIKIIHQGVEYMKFFTNQEEYDSIVENVGREERIVMDVIGRASKNEFRGRTTPQIMIEDYEVVGVKGREFAF